MENKSDELKVLILESDNVKMQTLENVKIIRIKDKKYNLLIMKDYWPVIGEIDGIIRIEADKEYLFSDIKGFYSLSHNIFHLIIKQKGVENDKNN